MGFDDLTNEQIEGLRNCESPEEIKAFMQEGDCDLTSDELKSLTGGAWINNNAVAFTCPNCGSTKVFDRATSGGSGSYNCWCRACGNKWVS